MRGSVYFDIVQVMANVDANTIGQLAVRLGLVSPDQVQDAMDELGPSGGEAEALLRHLERKGALTPWQSSKLLKGDTSGYFLGGYRILYKIASGSFGRVYRADDPNTGMVVAIKVLRDRWSEDKKNVELFEREGKLGMTMRHPNIVEILAVKRDDRARQHYLVMEFVEGGNLRDFLHIRKKLEPLEAIKIMEDTVSGLAYAYSRGLSHRDIKLTNILISSGGRAKLVDFGLAGIVRRMHKDDDVQADRTVDYAGLEKATGVPPGDVRSDIYFLGCCLYELLSGRPPLERTRNPYERMRKERFSKVKPLTTAEVSAPPSVFRLVETMMSLDPQQRFQTPNQLLDAIREVKRDLEGGSKAAVTRSVFIVEADTRLQDALRNRFKELGFRVLLSADPRRALERFRQQAFDALILDAGSVGEEGLFLFENVLKEANRLSRHCAGILILNEDQHEWAGRVEVRSRSKILVRPVTLKQVQRQLEMLLSGNNQETDGTSTGDS